MMRSGWFAAAVLFFALPAAAQISTFTIDPQIGPTTGYSGVHLHAQGFTFIQKPQVLFGTTPAPSFFPDGPTGIEVFSPPHAAGVVEIVVVQNGISYRSADRFTFVTVEPMEEIFVPIAVDAAPGAFGTRWTSELWVQNDTADAVPLTPQFCSFIGVVSPCDPPVITVPPHVATSLPMRGYSADEPWVLLFPPVSAVDHLSFSVRLRDANGDPAGAGTEIPVVRTASFKKRVVLPAIPTSDHFRAILRIYTRDTAIAVRVFDAATGELLDTRPIHRLLPTDFDTFGTVTIHDLLTTPLVRAHERVTVTVETPYEGVWVMMTLTDNATQRVTTFTPQAQ